MYPLPIEKAALIAILTASLISLTTGESALGAGKKPASAPNPSCPAPGAVAKPYRKVLMTSVATKPFPLPNGTLVDLTQDLNTMAYSVTTDTHTFRPSTVVDADCAEHLELHIGVSTLELNLYELGITIGYSPTGTSAVTSAEGEVNVRLGHLAMDFRIDQCNIKGCTQIIASTANATPVETDSSFKINFSEITTAVQLATHPTFNKLLRKIMTAGMTRLAQSPDVHHLPWRAIVRESNPSAGTLIFDAGTQDGIAANQNFAVYAVSPTTGVCDVYKTIAYIHTLRADPLSSFAIVDQVLDSQPIETGDLVVVK
ncbi:MAG TPA: hypothetical protein VJB59_10615 [Bdellovibrionota bacterium]|nr:hypothetical protein [Bdellovibrionota bacterium]